MRKRIVLISCAKKKSKMKSKAKNLYISTLFKLNLKYAQSLQSDGIYVLSAKYGLLDLEQEIEPYDETLKKMSAYEVRQWANYVIEQINQVCSIDETEFIFLAGEKYRKYLLPHINNSLIPLEGLNQGKQLQKLKELTS